MAEKRMACWNCPRYDRTERHCRDGKANPKKKADSVVVAELLGLRALCHYSPYRDALALRTHFPTAERTIQVSAPKPRKAHARPPQAGSTAAEQTKEQTEA